MKAPVPYLTRFRRFPASLVVAFGAAALAGDAPLANPSFETGTELPDGWTASTGAQTGASPDSAVAVDRTIASEGTASLRLSGDAATRRWQMVEQGIDIEPSERVTLHVAARCRGVTQDESQFANANAVLVFETAKGERRALLGSPSLRGDRDWTDLVIDAIAPADARRVRVGLLLSMTGTLWFDDVRLEHRPATVSDPAGRERAFDALAGHLRRTYPFFGYAGKPEADALFARHRAKAIEADGEQHFVAAIRAMLSELDDVHVKVHCSFGTFSTAKPRTIAPNWNSEAMAAALTERTAYEKNVLLAGRIGSGEDAIGYVAIASFQLDEAGIAKVIAAIDALADTKSLILDVRANGGGDEQLAARIAGRFTKMPVLYARSVWRDATTVATDAFLPPVDRFLTPVTVGRADTRRVAVLQGPFCVSSTEGFLAMMNALPNVTTIGLPSRGASGNPARFDVVPGISVFASRWRSLTPDDACIEGKGLAPRIVVDAPHEKADPTLERALAELRR